MGCHTRLQGIFQTQGLNLGLLYWRQILYHVSHQGNILTLYISSAKFFFYISQFYVEKFSKLLFTIMHIYVQGNLKIRSNCKLESQWHPTLVFLPAKPHGWRSLVVYSPWGR